MLTKLKFIAFSIAVLIPVYSICQSADTCAAKTRRDTTVFDFSKPINLKPVTFLGDIKRYIRFDSSRIYLPGKWCDMGTVEGNWKLQQDYASAANNCNGIDLFYDGKMTEHAEGDAVVYERRKIRYEIRGSILEFTVLVKDGTEEKECYTVVSASEGEIVLKRRNCN